MLRGMLGGLAAFVIFCALIAQLIEPAGVAVAFLLATVAAILAQIVVAKAASTGNKAHRFPYPRSPTGS
jgi:hypothetical protein